MVYDDVMDEMRKEPEKYIAVGVFSQVTGNDEALLYELSELIGSAGGECAGYMVQHLSAPDPATYIGSGKAGELKLAMEMLGADAVACDDELSPAQLKNLSDIIDAKVIDRTMLILDIFASRAKTREGKLQVEMAQLKYRSSHLTGMGKALSRLGGGIGTRGPGETKLESDRRVIQKRISVLGKEIIRLKQTRMVSRKERLRGKTPAVAIVGYTNAGKSTLLNIITASHVAAQDQLFATLDPTTRRAVLPGGREILFTDTVGFIDKLPHQLIDAFRSTLEEARYADVILHVVDASDPDMDRKMAVVYETLRELGIENRYVITAFNKMDKADTEQPYIDVHAAKCVRISAGTGGNLTGLYEAVSDMFRDRQQYFEGLIKYSEQSKLSDIRRYGQLLSEEYRGDGIYVKAYLMTDMFHYRGVER